MPKNKKGKPEGSEFENFDDVASRIFRVPIKEIQKLEAKEKDEKGDRLRGKEHSSD